MMLEPHAHEGAAQARIRAAAFASFVVREPEERYGSPPRLRLLDQVRGEIRKRHYSPRTEEAYVGWIRRFILFHRKRHPAEMGAAEVECFLSSLATDRRVAASTQNQALAALLFLYKYVLGVDLPWLDGLVRAMGLPGDAHVRRPGDAPTAPTPPARERRPALGPRGGASGRNHQACQLPHFASFVRDSSARRRLRHPHRPDPARSQRTSAPP